MRFAVRVLATYNARPAQTICLHLRIDVLQVRARIFHIPHEKNLYYQVRLRAFPSARHAVPSRAVRSEHALASANRVPSHLRSCFISGTARQPVGALGWQACPEKGCNKKVTESSDTNFYCEKCARSYPKCDHRYEYSEYPM